MKLLNYIKFALAFAGLILLFINLKGWLKDNDKTEFLTNIRTHLEVSPETKGAKKFLNNYFYILKMTQNEKEIQIDKIVYVGTFLKNGEDKKEPVAGVIKVRNINGETTPALASLNEIELWASETPFWNWIAWIAMVISLFIELGMTTYKYKRDTTKAKKS